MLTDDIVLYKQNRIDGKSANKAKFWCWHCDGALVGDWGKCPVCGLKQAGNKKKL